MTGRRSRVVKAGLVVALIALLAVGEWRLELTAFLGPDRLQAWLATFGDLAPVAFIGIMATAVVVSPIPSLPLDIAAGSFFGPLLGTLYAVVGALAGAIVSFLIARMLGRELIEPVLGGHINFCQDCSDKLLTKAVFLARLLPVVSFDIVSYGAGLTRMSLAGFIVASGLGMIPLTALYVTFGSALVPGPGLGVALALGLVALFFLVPRWIERHDLLSLGRFFRHIE